MASKGAGLGLLGSAFLGPVIIVVVITTIITPVLLKIVFRTGGPTAAQEPLVPENEMVTSYYENADEIRGRRDGQKIGRPVQGLMILMDREALFISKSAGLFKRIIQVQLSVSPFSVGKRHIWRTYGTQNQKALDLVRINSGISELIYDPFHEQRRWRRRKCLWIRWNRNELHNARRAAPPSH